MIWLIHFLPLLQRLRKLLRISKLCLRVPDPGTARAALGLPPAPNGALQRLSPTYQTLGWAAETLVSLPPDAQYRGNCTPYTGGGQHSLLRTTTTVLGPSPSPSLIPNSPLR